MKKVLMIVGSLRKNSFNRQLAKEIESLLDGRAETVCLNYSDLPYMNQDIEFPAPEAVARVRAAVLEADGIWICTPEYNHSIPGVLKNLLDWLSRPLEKDNREIGSAAKGKAVTIAGVAGRSAAGDSRKALKNVLETMSMKLVWGEGTGISLDVNAFQTDTVSFSGKIKAALSQQANAFLSELDK